MPVKDASPHLLAKPGLDRPRLVAVDPLDLHSAALDPVEGIPEDSLLFVDDSNRQAGMLVVHGINTAVLLEHLGELFEDCRARATEFEVRTWPEVLADQADESVAVAGRAAANSLAIHEHNLAAVLRQDVCDRCADDPAANHYHIGSICHSLPVLGLIDSGCVQPARLWGQNADPRGCAR
jgi:hypothetical protein